MMQGGTPRAANGPAGVPPRLPVLPARLLCDEMLQGLGRWLRAAGYDTAIAQSGARDCRIADLARQEGRLLLTCDRGFVACRCRLEQGLIVLSASGLEVQVAELNDRFAVDWLRAPFTRCLRDNSPLRPAGATEALAVPAKARALGGAVTACSACERIYWPGSHVRRMRRRLAAWQEKRVFSR